VKDVVALSLAFVDHWNRRDIDGIIAALTEDVVYQNVPLTPLLGRAAVRTFIVPNLTRMTRMEWIVHNLAVTAEGSKVLTERTDNFHFGDQRVSVPVMGVFEFRGELIAAWRDYADIGDFIRQMGAIGQRPGWDAGAPMPPQGQLSLR
jgi:limonene-1,2-epoxide hydrolase